MKFPIGSTVQVIDDKNVFYYGARGEVAGYNEMFNEYLVFFIAINEDTGEEFVYEECMYKEDEIFLVEEV